MERCFNCGTIMIKGICPECGYQYPFAFECQFSSGVTCKITKRLCRNTEEYFKCKVWFERTKNF